LVEHLVTLHAIGKSNTNELGVWNKSGGTSSGFQSNILIEHLVTFHAIGKSDISSTLTKLSVWHKSRGRSSSLQSDVLIKHLITLHAVSEISVVGWGVVLVVVDSLSVTNQQKNCKRCKGFHFIKIILMFNIIFMYDLRIFGVFYVILLWLCSLIFNILEVG
jgi:hypothetical protein